MNPLAPSAQYYEMPAATPAITQTVNIPQRGYQANLYSPETDFRSPFQKMAAGIRKRLTQSVNAITGSAAWALLGGALGFASTAVASTITGGTYAALPFVKWGIGIGATKGFFTGLKWADKTETVGHNKELTKARLTSQRIANMTADKHFIGVESANYGQKLNNEILEDELRLRHEQDPYLIELQKQKEELEIAKLEREQFQPHSIADDSGMPKQRAETKNYFAELDAMVMKG